MMSLAADVAASHTMLSIDRGQRQHDECQWIQRVVTRFSDAAFTSRIAASFQARLWSIVWRSYERISSSPHHHVLAMAAACHGQYAVPDGNDCWRNCATHAAHDVRPASRIEVRGLPALMVAKPLMTAPAFVTSCWSEGTEASLTTCGQHAFRHT